MNTYYEKAAHKGLDYGKDQPEPPNADPRVVRAVDHSRAFYGFRVSRKDMNNCSLQKIL